LIFPPDPIDLHATWSPATDVLSEAATGFWLLADQVSKRSEAERLANIHVGFAPGWVRAVREAFRLGNRQMETLLNASASTLERRQRQEQPLDLVASERLDRVAMIATRSMHVFETPERASHWILSKNPALGDRTPLELCETGIGAQQVHRVLAAIEYGGGA
jgi:putative toxin-antitoxin system antitoxin component (TIGR02293 family)